MLLHYREYNKKKAEEQKKAEELRKKAEEQKKLEEQKKAQIGPSQSPNAQGKKIPVISDEVCFLFLVAIFFESHRDFLRLSVGNFEIITLKRVTLKLHKA